MDQSKWQRNYSIEDEKCDLSKTKQYWNARFRLVYPKKGERARFLARVLSQGVPKDSSIHSESGEVHAREESS